MVPLARHAVFFRLAGGRESVPTEQEVVAVPEYIGLSYGLTTPVPQAARQTVPS